MRKEIPFGVASATEIIRQTSRHPDRIVVRKFGSVAKLLWPVKPAAQLASIAGTSERTAERWLSGEFEPPYCIIEATLHEIFALQGDE